MKDKLRLLLFGDDEDRYFCITEYYVYRMAERTAWERFCYRVLMPPIAAAYNWMDYWDLEFRMRYRDRWGK